MPGSHQSSWLNRSQWVSQWVTDKHSQWSDSGPIIKETRLASRRCIIKYKLLSLRLRPSFQVYSKTSLGFLEKVQANQPPREICWRYLDLFKCTTHKRWLPGTVESKSERGIPAPIPLARDMRRAVAMLDLESHGRSRSLWKTWSNATWTFDWLFLAEVMMEWQQHSH